MLNVLLSDCSNMICIQSDCSRRWQCIWQKHKPFISPLKKKKKSMLAPFFLVLFCSVRLVLGKKTGFLSLCRQSWQYYMCCQNNEAFYTEISNALMGKHNYKMTELFEAIILQDYLITTKGLKGNKGK